MNYQVKAYAKVNIGLRVLPLRPDGYHPLRTNFHLIALHDVITLEISEASALTVRIEGNESYLPKGGTDLMEKAARAFSSHTGLLFSLYIRIEKRIPSQAGLGGGSSDAAAVLLKLNQHFSSPLSRSEILDIALSLGSDVPFFASGFSSAYAEGRGELLSKREAVSFPILLVWRRGSRMSTREAFRLLDERAEVSDYIGEFPQPLERWREEYVNDFTPLFELAADPLFNAAERMAAYSSVSGSGSVFFMVFDNTATRLSCISRLLNGNGSIDILSSELYCISDL